jgi:NADPH2:quinone reductase
LGSSPIENPESLVEVDIPQPEPTGRDLRVRVKAVSVNPVDYKVRGREVDEALAPRILGWDVAGIVEAVGNEASLFKVGDAVFYAGDITRPGGNSEFHLVDERIVGRKPTSLSFEEAAAMPLTAITAWEALFDRLGIDPSADNSKKSILIIGGAGGVGSIAIQLAKRVAGLQVIATASRPETTRWCINMGADHTINHHQPFQAQFSALGLAEVDYIFCCASGGNQAENMVAVIKPQGKLSMIVDIEHESESFDINLFKPKSVGLMWELMFTRPMFQTEDIQAQHDLLNETAQLLDEGVLQHTMTENFGPLTAARLREAHAKLESGRMIGKLVLSGF